MNKTSSRRPSLFCPDVSNSAKVANHLLRYRFFTFKGMQFDRAFLVSMEASCPHAPVSDIRLLARHTCDALFSYKVDYDDGVRVANAYSYRFRFRVQ